jgi:hypothetical protein
MVRRRRRPNSAGKLEELPHSIRGFLSATIKTKMRLKVVSERPEGKARRYRVAGAE